MILLVLFGSGFAGIVEDGTMAGKDDKPIHDRGSHFPKWNHDASQQYSNPP